MGKNSKISWTDHTFNAWWGCTKVSEGCQNCYAERIAKRFGWDVWGQDKPRRVLSERMWGEPLKWDRDAAKAGERALVFCGSMCDIFDPDASVEAKIKLYKLIEQCKNLDWLLLTKRIERTSVEMWHTIEGEGYDWLVENPHVWLGVTVENQKRADERIPLLAQIPAKVRWLSIEPMLSGIDLYRYDFVPDWVIVGGESGHNARPMRSGWVLQVQDYCADKGVPFFFKQWGDCWSPGSPDKILGKEYKAFPPAGGESERSE